MPVEKGCQIFSTLKKWDLTKPVLLPFF